MPSQARLLPSFLLGQTAPEAARYTRWGLMGLVLRAPGMTVQGYFPELEPGRGGLTVLPKAGLQRAADLLLGAKIRSSQILWESASSLFTLHNVGAVQNLADFASRDEYIPPFLGHLLPSTPGLPGCQSPGHLSFLLSPSPHPLNSCSSSLYRIQYFLVVVLSF